MFAPQTFGPGDLGVMFLLVLLEGLWSADNALVLASMVRGLPQEQQKKALTYGLVGAFVFRAIAIGFASMIIKLWWLQAVGAIYLLFLPIKHFITLGNDKDIKAVNGGFWKTVIAVEITDIAFAVDSVLAGVAMVHSHSKIWVVYGGGVIGVILLRFAAQAFIGVLKRYPTFDHVAYLLVGWAGVKLGFVAGHGFEQVSPGVLSFDIPEMSQIMFWTVMILIAGLGTFVALRLPASDGDEKPDKSAPVDSGAPEKSNSSQS